MEGRVVIADCVSRISCLLPRTRRALWLCPALVLLLVTSLRAQADTPEVVIQGGSDQLRDNVRSFIALDDEPCNTPEWRLRSRLREVDRQIQNAAQPLGYYHLEARRELTRDDDCWGLNIRLSPGEPVRLTRVDLRVEGEGKTDKGFRAILEDPGLAEGDQLHHGRYESLKGRFGALASARGYFDGHFERSRVTVDKEANTAHLELVYRSGPRYQFGEVTLEHDVLDEAFLRRYLNFTPGDAYNIETLLELKSYYSASDYFSSVSVAPRLQELDNQRVPVLIELEERRKHGYSGGIGYASDVGPRLLLGYENRYVNDRGHSFNADLTVSELGGVLEASYRIPMSRPAHESLRLYTGYQREETDHTSSKVTTLGTSYSRSEEGSPWLQNYSLNFQREYYIVGDEPETRVDLLIPAVSLSRTKSDDSNYPLSGWRVLGRLSGSPTTLGSDVSFLQTYGRGKYIQAVGPGRLLLRLEAGVTQVGDFSELPVSQRFFAGGDASVRGYDYKSLGPTGVSDETGEELVVGGSHLITTSVEYDYRFLPSWAAAVFIDQGNAADQLDFDFKRSVGVGIRWISPVGPVRVDVARALDEPGGWGLHLSMGPDL